MEFGGCVAFDAEVLFSAAMTSESRYCFDIFLICFSLNQNHSGSSSPGSDVLPALFLKLLFSSLFVLHSFLLALLSLFPILLFPELVFFLLLTLLLYLVFVKPWICFL